MGNLRLFIYVLERTEISSNFDARRGRKHAVPALLVTHTGRIQYVQCVVVMEGVLAGRVVAVYGSAFETINRCTYGYAK